MTDSQIIHSLRSKAKDPRFIRLELYGLLNEAADAIERLTQNVNDKQSTINRLSQRARVVR